MSRYKALRVWSVVLTAMMLIFVKTVKVSNEANDRMVASSYQAFGHFPLWNAWVRLWLSSTLFGDLRLFRLCLKYLETRDGAGSMNLRSTSAMTGPWPGAKFSRAATVLVLPGITAAAGV